VPRMPQATQPSQAHTDSEEIIVGVDTHKDVHVAAVISVLGVLLGTASFPTTAAGYRQLLTWVRGFGTLRWSSHGAEQGEPMFVRMHRHDCPLSYGLRPDGQPNPTLPRPTDSPGRSTPT
jgi:hypothetical protein